MIMMISWYPDAWNDYPEWQARDGKTLRKINELIRDIARNSYSSIGKPEPLKGALSGWWSRRINGADRIVYKVEGEIYIIAQVKGHYDI